MASEIHMMNNSQKDNLNLMNESVVYDIITANNFLHDITKYDRDQHEYRQYNNGKSEINKYMDPNMNNNDLVNVHTTYSMMPPPPPTYKMVNYNNNYTVHNIERRDDYKTTRNCNNNHHHNKRATSPKGYESDDSGGPTSAKGLSHNDVNKKKPNKNHNHKNYQRGRQNYNNSTVAHPELYQPNKNHLNHSRAKYNKNNDVMLVMERRAHGLMERFKSRINKLKVVPNPIGLLNGGILDQLNQTIWDVFINKIQTEKTYLRKLDLWHSIFLKLRGNLTSYGLFMVGSTMSGFGLEGSDIDMCLLTKPFSNDPKIDSLYHLNFLRTIFLRDGIANDAELITAKVPILKFKNAQTGFEIDLNCNNAVGIRNTHLLYSYSQLDWRVRPLVVIVKLWAQANHINDAKNMTISSYSWALMVIHYLQCGVQPSVLPCLHTLVPEKFKGDLENQSLDVQEDIDYIKQFESDNNSCLGDLLIGFFHYYSNFNYTQFAISVRAGCRLPIDECRFMIKPKNDPSQWKLLGIEEPFDFSNTARSVFDPIIFKHIKEIICCSYKELARTKMLTFILPVDLNRHR